MKYRVIIGFDVIATDVLDAEAEVSKLIQDATNLGDLKEDMCGLKVVTFAEIQEKTHGVEKTQ